MGKESLSLILEDSLYPYCILRGGECILAHRPSIVLASFL